MNKKIKLWALTIFLISFVFLPLQGEVSLDIKLRFFEGLREGMAEMPQVVTSSYLQPTVSARIRSKYLLAEEQAQIKKVFNLKDVRLITEADLQWESLKSDKIFHILRLDSKEYLVLITPISPVSKRQFRIEVFEQSPKGKNSLLDTEVILPKDNIAIFGFEDLQGKPYFVSFHITKTMFGGVVGGVMGGVVGGVEGGVKGGVSKGVAGGVKEGVKGVGEDFTKGAVRAIGEIKPPKLIKKVNPIYPEEARKAKVEGIVILKARADEQGNIEKVRILKSKDPYLSQAALEAVRKWKYEPFYLKGKPTPIVFTITVNFKLREEEKPEKSLVKGVVLARGEIKPPRLIKKVEPVYPPQAKQKGIEGIVILEVQTDAEGNVDKVNVLKSESTLFNKAAIEAVKQWKYEPVIIKGKPTPIIFIVTVAFRQEEEKAAKN